MMRRVGILGGTFDPIHQGHLNAGVAAQEALGLSPVLVMPSHVPPHRRLPVASAFHRFAMVALAVADRPDWQASDFELTRAEPSFTVTTLERLHALGHRPTELFFIVGADAFGDIRTWKDHLRVLDGAHFVVVSRPGSPATALAQTLPMLADRIVSASADDLLSSAPRIVPLDVQTGDASSTAVRAQLAAGLRVAGVLPRAVAQHIEQHGLYTPTGTIVETHHRAAFPAADRLHGKS